ncbi:MAG: outer membrane beta-barrel protein [Sulfuricella sp.]|nr:outer membrane beta-barrel protein [Sulfuricella sp.]
MKVKLLVSVGLALGLTAGAVASSMAATDWGTSAAWYVGLSGGQSKTEVGGGDINSAIGTTGGSVDDTDTGWKAFLGYQFSPNIAVEAGYVDFGKFNFSSAAGNGDLKTSNSGYIDAVGILPFQNFSIFGKLGAYTIKTELNGAGVSNSHTTNDWTYGVGAGYDFTRNLGVRVEWERFNGVGDNSTTKGDLDLASVGVLYKF